MQFFIITTTARAALAIRAIRQINSLQSPCEIHVVAGGDVRSFIPHVARVHNVIVHPEREFAPHLDLASISQWAVDRFPQRANWYYQQFLKMAVAESAVADDKFVIWDADTIPYRKMEFFAGEAHCFTVHQREFHLPYFETNKRLIGVARHEEGPRISAVSQHMPVVKGAMRRLLENLAAQSNGSWTETIQKVIGGRQGLSLFSEYELYFDYITALKMGEFRLVYRPWFRRGRSCWPDQRFFLRHASCFVSYETWDMPKSFSLGAWGRRWRDVWQTVHPAKPRDGHGDAFKIPGGENARTVGL